MTSSPNESARQLLDQLRDEMVKNYFDRGDTTSSENIKAIENSMKTDLCTQHHLSPNDVDVSCEKAGQDEYTFTVSERIPSVTITIPIP